MRGARHAEETLATGEDDAGGRNRPSGGIVVPVGGGKKPQIATALRAPAKPIWARNLLRSGYPRAGFELARWRLHDHAVSHGRR